MTDNDGVDCDERVILVIGGLSIQTHTEVGPTSFATVLEKHPS